MKSRAARLTLLVLFVMALGVTAYLFGQGRDARAGRTAAARSVQSTRRVGAGARTSSSCAAAQQAYVATGQGGSSGPRG